MKKEQVLEQCDAESVRFVNMQFCDLFGFVKSVTIPISKLEGAIEDNVWFDGSSIEGFTRIYESDMYLKPDLNTFAIVPWEGDEDNRVARIICDIYMPDGKPFEGDPRYILRKQVERAEKLGYTYYVGPELEFFLFETDEDGKPYPEPHDQAGYFDYAMDRAGSIRQAMSDVVSVMGVDVETIHHEVAEGQHEIDFKYNDAISQADAVLTVKIALKAVARDYGLHATFMPKPIAGINGSGMHVHQSLFRDGKNAFFDKDGVYNVSELAQNFIAGQLKHVDSITAILNPTVNSYKRLVPGYEAPVYVSWGQTNRSALIRIPRYTKGRENAVRCELRSPDASTNPYLAFAAMLAAGLDGIENKIQTPDPIEENIYEFTEKKAKRMRIRTLPGSLNSAINKFEKSNLAKEVLGEHAFEKYIEAKKAKILEYRLFVSQWEIDEYMELF